MSSGLDLVILYKILKKLTTPFNQTEAYKLGLIDEKGKVLKQRNSLTTTKEKDALTLLDIFVFNIKKLLTKIPGGNTRLATFAAALFLIKENKNPTKEEFIVFLKENLTVINESFIEHGHLLKEDSPTVSAGSGAIAGIGVGPDGEPPGKSKVKKTKFAGHDVFLVDPNVYLKARLGKKKYLKYKTYVGEDETGEEIRLFARNNPDKPVILQNQDSGEMMFLRRGRNPNRMF